MADVFAVGRVTADFELKISANKNPYVRFGLAENIGKGANAKTQYYQVFAFGEKAEQLVKAKVGKGHLLHISGQLELEDFLKKDGVTPDKRLKVTLYNWRYVRTRKSDRQDPQHPEDITPPVLEPPEIDGEREPLPG